MAAEFDRAGAAALLAEQARWCHDLGSLLYGDLLDRSAEDCRGGGQTWAILATAAERSRASAPALRFLGAVHRLALTGAAPQLAAVYPSAGGRRCDDTTTWIAFAATLAQHEATIVRDLSRPVQTNEVGRAAVFAGGFLTIAAETGLPLRLLEVGCSAGLNLRWDRFHYASDHFTWGDPESGVRFAATFAGDARPALAAVDVVARHGCDPQLLDPLRSDDALTLRSYLWPDQTERRARLDAAIEIARTTPVETERADAVAWLSRQLSARCRGVATVIFHSVVLQYMGRERVADLDATIRSAGAGADDAAPIAWLSFEPERSGDATWRYALKLTLWPGGRQRTLAEASPHGPPVRWLA